MKKTTTLLLLLVLTVAGCSSTDPVTAPSDRDTSTATTSADASPPDSTTSATSAEASPSASRDWHHFDRVKDRGPGLDTHQAYRTLLQDRPPQDTVVVAIIDSGTDVDHEDLSAQAWTNSDEVPGNDEDDDENGYVDDVHGWNFIGGPNGQNVNEDTYELTRLYVKLHDRFGDVDSSEVASEARDDYRRYQTLKRKFEQKRREAKNQLQKVRQVRDGLEFSEKVLQNHLGTDSLTREAVDTLSTEKDEVREAKDIRLYFYRQNLSPDDVREYYDYLKRQVEYNYNPDFNPRSIVGDDYSDKTERRYGNNDVTGPEAGHGTHVAGIVAATRNNDIGIDGIARGVRIMPIRTVPNGDERDKDVANAIRYAVNNGADVINMSFGKAYSPHKDVVDAAVQHADSMGVLMIHAAGNDGANVDSTENYPTPEYEDGGEAKLWIEVGASSWKGEQQLAAPFSNYGRETVDVFAPGHAIYSTAPDDEYDHNDGTSMAAPMVSGVAALVMAHYPTLTPEEVRTLLLETATSYRDVEVTRPGGTERVSFGELSKTGAVVNAPAALKRAAEMANNQ